MHSFSVCCAGDAAAAPTSRRLTWSAVAIASSGVATGCRGGEGGAVHKKSVIINARKKPKIAASVAFVFQVFGSAGSEEGLRLWQMWQQLAPQLDMFHARIEHLSIYRAAAAAPLQLATALHSRHARALLVAFYYDN